MRKDEKEKFDQARDWLVNGTEEQVEAAMEWMTSSGHQPTEHRRLRAVEEVGMPWDCLELKDWQIIGMNHYTLGGKRHLFVAMVNGSRWIRAEGTDEQLVFSDLARQALGDGQYVGQVPPGGGHA